MTSEKTNEALEVFQEYNNYINKVPKKKINSILKRGFPTGSVVFCSPDLAFDRDYCIISEDPISEFEYWVRSQMAWYAGHDYRNNEFMAVYMMSKDDLLYNFLLMKEDEFLVWKLATRKMRQYVNRLKNPKTIWYDKEHRVEIFEEFKEQAREYNELGLEE